MRRPPKHESRSAMVHGTYAHPSKHCAQNLTGKRRGCGEGVAGGTNREGWTTLHDLRPLRRRTQPIPLRSLLRDSQSRGLTKPAHAWPHERHRGIANIVCPEQEPIAQGQLQSRTIRHLDASRARSFVDRGCSPSNARHKHLLRTTAFPPSRALLVKTESGTSLFRGLFPPCLAWARCITLAHRIDSEQPWKRAREKFYQGLTTCTTHERRKHGNPMSDPSSEARGNGIGYTGAILNMPEGLTELRLLFHSTLSPRDPT